MPKTAVLPLRKEVATDGGGNLFSNLQHASLTLIGRAGNRAVRVRTHRSEPIVQFPADHLSENNNIKTTIPLPSAAVALSAVGIVLPKPSAVTQAWSRPYLSQKAANQRGAVFRKLLVELIAADAVGVAFDGQDQ